MIGIMIDCAQVAARRIISEVVMVEDQHLHLSGRPDMSRARGRSEPRGHRRWAASLGARRLCGAAPRDMDADAPWMLSEAFGDRARGWRGRRWR